jgi:hypothetical protein
MALDTNIALGVRPVEQPNMLAQMGQMMQMRQMQQGYESENALRDFYAQGGNISTDEGKRQLMSKVGLKGMDIIGKQSEIASRDIGTAEKSLAMLKDQAGLVRNPQDAANWLSSFYKNPLTRPYVEAVAPMDRALAAIPTDPAGFEKWLRGASLKAKDIFESADARLAAQSRIQAAGISAGPANARLAWEKQQQAEVEALMRGGLPSAAPATAPMTGGGGGVPNALPAAVGATPVAPTTTNMLVPNAQPPAAAQAPVVAQTQASSDATTPGDVFDKIKAIDAKIAPLANSGNPRATAILQQLIAQRNSLIESAKREFGGDRIDMAVEDPKRPGTFMTVKGQIDQYGVAHPLKAGPMPRTVDISTGTSIDLPVARPAPRAGYQYNAENQEVKIPQTGVPDGLRLKPGERWNEEKQSVEQVPGSAAFIEQQKKHGADLNAVKTAQATTKWGTERIDKILDPKNKTGFENNFGGFTAYGTKEFSGNTALVKSELDSLKSDLKNKGLQMMRVGGSIGAMTEKEWPIVESMLATLSPKMDVKDARDVLEAVRAKFEALENLAAEKYNDQWQGTQYHKPVSTSGAAPALTGEDKAAMDWANANPKDPRAAQIRQRLGG